MFQKLNWKIICDWIYEKWYYSLQTSIEKSRFELFKML